VTGSNGNTRRVGRVFYDVITTTDTGVVCDSTYWRRHGILDLGQKRTNRTNPNSNLRGASTRYIFIQKQFRFTNIKVEC
jgi:hypothetical protein